ncbi:MAG: hypothetical protein E6772_16260 [Dysgonomonas sp.]|nr:hypothetical protein [Dysgonomonas sp.]
MEDNKKISGLLLKKAIELNLCQPWQDAWNDDFSALMNMYKRGMDFCVEHDYPSLDILRQYLKGKTEDYNIFIDSDKEIEIYSDTVVVVGDSHLKINIADYGVLNLYVRHNSKTIIYGGEHSVINVETYDNSVLEVENTCNVNVYQYDNSTATGESIIIHKRERNAK